MPATDRSSAPDDVPFYVTGGTLRPDAPSYVERQADRDLYAGLLRGEFCYVLTARQMGKSSLMVHTAARLRQAGVRVAVIDLTAIGQYVTVEQWYDGLLRRIGQHLDLEDELEQFWHAQSRLPPLQRWLAALEAVVSGQWAVGSEGTGRDRPARGSSGSELPTAHCPLPTDPLVLFIDEIDAVRSLPFSTDEFFAAVRECYNRRAQEPAYERLTFCLLGVATPSELIQDTRTTPFNIGRRIELTDFTPAEAAPLAEGLVGGAGLGQPHPPELLQRILYWTGGHPYLTQRLCRAVAERGGVAGARELDRLCAELFFSLRAQEQEDNLLFVRERLLRSEADRAALLDLYGQVRAGKAVRLDDTSQLVSILRLSGITRVVSGCLRVRNRIYARVFDRGWVTQQMPDAELRRQQAAYRRGLLRAAAVSGVILAVMAGLALAAVQQARRAEEHLYAAHMPLALQAWEEGNLTRARELLAAHGPGSPSDGLRGFEWRYLWRLCQDESQATLRGHTAGLSAIAFAPDGKKLASTAFDGTIRLWEIPSGRNVAILRGHRGPVLSLAWSPTGATLATGGSDHTIRLWDVDRRRQVALLTGHTDSVDAVTFSPDGRMLASGGRDTSVRLWDVSHRRELAPPLRRTDWVSSLAFTPGADFLAVAAGSTVRLWDLRARRAVAALTGHTGYVGSIAVSPDGKTMASAGPDTVVKLWDLRAKRERMVLRGHLSGLFQVAFSPDGRTLASCSADHTTRLWNVATGEVTVLRGHTDQVTCVAFAPRGGLLATGSGDGTIKLWRRPDRPRNVLLAGRHWTHAVAIAPNGRLLAAAYSNGVVRLWDLASQRVVATLKGHSDAVVSVAFSRDGKTLATGSWDRSVKLWDIATRRLIAVPGRHGNWVSSVAFARGDKILASRGDDQRVRLWDIAAGRPLGCLPVSAGAPVSAMAVAPTGDTLALSARGTIQLWDMVRRRQIASFKGGSGGEEVRAFSTDGRLLATVDPGHSVALWEVAAKRAVATLQTGPVGEVAFSPDGRTLAVSTQSVVKLWSLRIMQEVATLRGHTSQVDGVAFSPDGSVLASASGDGTVRLWRAAPFTETDRPSSGQAVLIPREAAP